MNAPAHVLRRFLRPAPERGILPRPSGWLAASASAMRELASACNVVRLGEWQINRKLERRGIKPDTVRLGDATVRFYEGGPAGSKSPPVVLLHGFGASSIWQWHEQVGPLARKHRVIMPDLLWFGGSWSKRREFGIDHQIQVVVDLLDHLGIEQAHFVGISYGGIVAHELAAKHPDRVHKLAILDSPGRVFTARDHEQMLQRFSVENVGELLVPQTPDDVQVLLELGYHKPPKTPRWIHAQVLSAMYGTFREEKTQLLETLVAELDELDERPGKVTHETLLIWGEHDSVFPLEIGRRLEAEMRGRAQLRVVQGAGHAPNLEHGSLVARWLGEFFA
jgi:pimeloyl-ACP methyl ester carboxylesterase